MTDRPILFSAPMVRALLAGSKTQTRRTLNPQPGLTSSSGTSYICKDGKGHSLRISIGDRLWVREAWRTQKAFDAQSPVETIAEFGAEWGAPSIPSFYEADGKCDDHSTEQWQESPAGRLRASMHMPRCASRLTLTVTDVRVERLQDIILTDLEAEGIVPAGENLSVDEALAAWQKLWDGINGQPSPVKGEDGETSYFVSYPWGGEARTESFRGKPHHVIPNPWVAAYTFKVHHGNIDQIGGAP